MKISIHHIVTQKVGNSVGSAIAIVKKDKAEAFKKNVGKIYRDKVGYDASFYDAEIVDGTKKI